MKHLNFCIVAATVLLTLSGCIEEYEADISTEDSNLLVVEGTICSGKLNTFTLTRTLPLSVDHEYYWTNETYGVNGTYAPYPQMVYEAKVSVRGSDGSEYRAEFERGCYECWIANLTPTWTTVCISRLTVRCMNQSLRNLSVPRR